MFTYSPIDTANITGEDSFGNKVCKHEGDRFEIKSTSTCHPVLDVLPRGGCDGQY
jgi:hypothetical protein